MAKIIINIRKVEIWKQPKTRNSYQNDSQIIDFISYRQLHYYNIHSLQQLFFANFLTI